MRGSVYGTIRRAAGHSAFCARGKDKMRVPITMPDIGKALLHANEFAASPSILIMTPSTILLSRRISAVVKAKIYYEGQYDKCKLGRF